MRLRLVAVLLFAPMVLAQSPAPASQEAPIVSTRTTLVLVPALVLDKNGEPIFALTAKDFTVTDDGIEQAVRVEEDTDSQPLALVVVVETGGAGAGQLGKYRDLGTWVETIVGNVPHMVALVSFDSTAKVVQGFTPDLDQIGAGLGGLSAGDNGAAVLDGLNFAVNMIRKQPPTYRRAILLVSERVDQGSTTSFDEALRAISDTNTAIYTLGFSSTKAVGKKTAAHTLADSRPGPAGGCMAKDPDDPDQNKLNQAFDCLSLLVPPLRLAKAAAEMGVEGMRRNVPESVAELTGGEYFSFKDARGIDRDLLAISHHLPNRYVLSFQPTDPHAGFHTIGLKLKSYPKLDVTARNGYWVDEEAGTQAGH